MSGCRWIRTIRTILHTQHFQTAIAPTLIHQKHLHRSTISRSWGIVALVILGSWGLVSCQLGIDTTAIETAIQEDIESQGDIAIASIDCPRTVKPAVGESFRCVGQLEPERAFVIHVTQVDEAGNMDWDVPTSKALLNLSELESHFQTEIASETGTQPLIDCGSIYRINQPGDSFECAVRMVKESEEETQPVLVEVVVNIDPQGNVNWQQVRRATQAQQAQADEAKTTASAASADLAPAPETATPASTTKATTPDGTTEPQAAEEFLNKSDALDGF